jgi:hypothetical protein
MPFTNWLLRQGHRIDIIGDFAKDVRLDTTRPYNGIKAWRKHLIRHLACGKAFKALELAWEEYKAIKEDNLYKEKRYIHT